MKENLLEKYSALYASPYLVGIFMGVNAIKDIALFVDGPDCNFFRVDMIYKTHDLFSTLKLASIDTRLYFSGVMPNKMISGYEDKIKRKLELIEKNDSFKLGVVTSMPVTSLLGVQYDSIFDGLKKDFISVPSFTDKFWIDGYSIFLKEIAKNIELDSEIKKKKNNISIIGNLFDRNEGDNIGNIEELKRILSLIGVEINSIWLSGGNYEELKGVEKSELLVSLPYGKYASEILKKRVGTESLELDIPFGLKNTIEFIKSIGSKLEISESLINEVINKELNNIKGKVDLLDSNIFLNKNFVYAGDPFFEKGIKDIANFLGMNHIKTFKYTGDKLNNTGLENVDFVIGNSEYNLLEKNKIEFSFPSYNTHFFTNKAFMGFEGLLNFIERLYNDLNK